jgi:glycosyltransferase involved in cell wall biosynthesis
MTEEIVDKKVVVSVVIPVFNEQGNLEGLIKRCIATCDTMALPYEVILIDDGSKDRSVEMITASAQSHQGKIVGVLLNRNYGQHSAIMAGFSHVRGAYVVTLDADLQNPPEEITRVVAKTLHVRLILPAKPAQAVRVYLRQYSCTHLTGPKPYRHFVPQR